MNHQQASGAARPSPLVSSPCLLVPRTLLCIKYPALVTRGPWLESNKRMLYSSSRLPREARSRRLSHLLHPKKQDQLLGDPGLLYGGTIRL